MITKNKNLHSSQNEADDLVVGTNKISNQKLVKKFEDKKMETQEHAITFERISQCQTIGGVLELVKEYEEVNGRLK